MKSPESNSFNLDRRLAFALALLIGVILGGNGLVILQFEKARLQTGRLMGISQQLIVALRLQQSLLSFHQRLNELAESRDERRLGSETTSLSTALLERVREARRTLLLLPAEFRVDATFLTVLNTIDVTLPSQLHDLAALAAAGDWEGVRVHVDDELHRVETTTAGEVDSIDRELNEELPIAVANMSDVERRVLVTVPVTAISTVLIAAFLGWATARRILELRLEERVRERTRIARDLHDTLLQTFHGLVLRLQVAYDLMPAGEARDQLEQGLRQADQAQAEGRTAVGELRSSAVLTNHLTQAVQALGDELATDDAAVFRLQVQGVERELDPIVRDEVYRFARESLRNAFRHAQARNIETEFIYGKRVFRLRIRDDGNGIPPEILQRGRSGHYGLPGMRERARQIGGKLAIWSGAGTGTEIELNVRGSIAYATSGRSLRRLFGGNGKSG
jgi:signal transduction histidine kinase